MAARYATAMRKGRNGRQFFPPSQEDATAYGHKGRMLMGGGSQPVLDTQTSAKLAQAAYTYGGAGGTNEEREKATNQEVESTGFKLVPSMSDRQMSVFEKVTPDGRLHIHIAHKGTQPTSLGGLRDLVSDARIAFDTSAYDSQFQERKKRSEDAVRELAPDIVTMSGHSLGGATVSSALVGSKLLRNVVDQADTFDAGATPLGANMDKRDPTKEEKARLWNNLTHHRMEHDLVSKGLLQGKRPIGDVITYDLATDNSETLEQAVDEDQLKAMSIPQRALFAHHIDHFSERDELVPKEIRVKGPTMAEEAIERVTKKLRRQEEGEQAGPDSTKDLVDGSNVTEESAAPAV